jgi:hypothetical protein
MHIQVSWIDEANSVLLVKFNPGWSWNEYHTMISERQQQHQAGRFVYVIADMNEGGLPKSGSAVAQHRAVSNESLVIIVTKNAFLRVMAELGIKLFHSENRYRLASSYAEAEQIIATHRSPAAPAA